MTIEAYPVQIEKLEVLCDDEGGTLIAAVTPHAVHGEADFAVTLEIPRWGEGLRLHEARELADALNQAADASEALSR